MKLPKLPAPMMAKFVYPDMSELNLSTGRLSSGSICALPSSYLFSSERWMSNSFRYVRAMGIVHFFPSHDYHPLLSELLALSISAMVTLTKSLAQERATLNNRSPLLPSTCLRIELCSESASTVEVG